MSKISAVLDQIEAEQRQQVSEPIPDNISLAELAKQVVRGKVKLSREQMRMLIELLPFYMPKLSSVALGYLDAIDFASRLDRAIDRRNNAKLIEGRAVVVEDHE
jgi:hypothetical protein